MTLALQLFKNSNDTRGKLRLNFHSLNVSVSELLEYGRMTRWAFYKSTAGSLLFILVNISFGKSLVIPLDSKCSFLSIVCFGEFVANDNWQGRREGGAGGSNCPGPRGAGGPRKFFVGPQSFLCVKYLPRAPANLSAALTTGDWQHSTTGKWFRRSSPKRGVADVFLKVYNCSVTFAAWTEVFQTVPRNSPRVSA
jgi:hypothetical protein